MRLSHGFNGISRLLDLLKKMLPSSSSSSPCTLLERHKVTVKAMAKANADFCFLGHCVFPQLLKPEAVHELLDAAKAAEYTEIFNHFGSKFSCSAKPV
jgi:hypothetical protein